MKKTADIEIFPGTGPRDPRAILQAVQEQVEFEEVLVLGWKKEDKKLFVAGSMTNVKDMHWLLSCADDDLFAYCRWLDRQEGSDY